MYSIHFGLVLALVSLLHQIQCLTNLSYVHSSLETTGKQDDIKSIDLFSLSLPKPHDDVKTWLYETNEIEDLKPQSLELQVETFSQLTLENNQPSRKRSFIQNEDQILEQDEMSNQIEDVPLEKARLQEGSSEKVHQPKSKLTREQAIDILAHIIGESVKGGNERQPRIGFLNPQHAPDFGKTSFPLTRDFDENLQPKTRLQLSKMSKEEVAKLKDYVTICDSPYKDLLEDFFTDNERQEFETLFTSYPDLVQQLRLRPGARAEDFAHFRHYVEVFITQTSEALDEAFSPDEEQRLGDIAELYPEYMEVLTEKASAMMN